MKKHILLILDLSQKYLICYGRNSPSLLLFYKSQCHSFFFIRTMKFELRLKLFLNFWTFSLKMFLFCSYFWREKMLFEQEIYKRFYCSLTTFNCKTTVFQFAVFQIEKEKKRKKMYLKIFEPQNCS